MTRPIQRLAPLLFLLALTPLVFLYGCDSAGDLVSASNEADGRGAHTGPDFELGDGLYDITVHHDYHEAANVTIFRYLVENTSTSATVSHFLIEHTACAPSPTVYSPSNSVSLNTDQETGIYGIKWKLNVASAQKATYEVTYPGRVYPGRINAAVKAGNVSYSGEIIGACGRADISGTVYIDGNKDGVFSSGTETGIAGRTVTVTDASGNVLSRTTDASGFYHFQDLNAGAYTVNAPETLFGYVDPTTLVERSVEIAPDATVDFGYVPSSGKISNAFSTGDVASTGLPPKEWVRIFDSAIKNQKNAPASADSLASLLDAIETLALSDPFVFTGSRDERLAAAVGILKMNAKTDLEKFYLEMFALELNYAAGLGPYAGSSILSEMHLSVIQWAESEYVLATGAAAKSASTAATTSLDSYSTMLLLNRSGGGSGGVGGG